MQLPKSRPRACRRARERSSCTLKCILIYTMLLICAPCQVNSGPRRIELLHEYVSIDSGTKAMSDRQLLPSLLREGTGCRCRTIPLRDRTLRIYRTIPTLRTERTVHSPGQRDS